MIPDLLVLGNLIVDDVVLPDGTTRMGQPGGAVVYAALGAALWGTRVGVVSRVGDDYPRETLEALEARGIDLSGVRQLGRAGLRTWLLYEARGRRLLHHRGCPTHAEATPSIADVPPGWAAAATALLTPAPLAEQRQLIEALRASGGARIAVDPHTPIADDTLADWQTVLARVHHFFVSESEVQLAASPGAPTAFPAWCPGGQLRTLALKRGEQGGVLFDVGSGQVITWSPRAAAIVDPTGAGDAFAGGFLSALIDGAAPQRALARGVVSASYALEGWGPEALLSATPRAAAARLRQWFPER